MFSFWLLNVPLLKASSPGRLDPVRTFAISLFSSSWELFRGEKRHNPSQKHPKQELSLSNDFQAKQASSRNTKLPISWWLLLFKTERYTGATEIQSNSMKEKMISLYHHLTYNTTGMVTLETQTDRKWAINFFGIELRHKIMDRKKTTSLWCDIQSTCPHTNTTPFLPGKLLGPVQGFIHPQSWFSPTRCWVCVS